MAVLNRLAPFFIARFPRKTAAHRIVEIAQFGFGRILEIITFTLPARSGSQPL